MLSLHDRNCLISFPNVDDLREGRACGTVAFLDGSVVKRAFDRMTRGT